MTLRSLLSCAAILVALLSLAACEQDGALTQVIVVVHADSDEVGEQLTTVRARVLSADGQSDALPEREREFSLTPNAPAGSREPTLPFSFAITKNQASRFLLVLSGYGAQSSEPLIEQRLTVSFRNGHTIYVDVLLGRACLGQASACAALDQICHPMATDVAAAGACGPVLDATSRPGEPGDEFDAGSLTEPDDVDAEEPSEVDGGPGAELRDGGTLDSQTAMDAALASDANPGDAASSVPDAANDTSTTVPAEAGAVCQGPNTKACDGNASRQKLACVNGQWAPNGSCDGNTRCQTRSDSPDLGTCMPIVSACAGKQPGAAVCDGTVRRSCGPDLVDYTANPCPAHASCRDQNGSVSCTCDAPYMSDGMGGCTVPICMQMPCMNGGVCSISGSGRTCNCAAVDYSGASCETRIDDCAASPCAHGRCVDGVRSRTCDCTNSGYEGPTCATNINECARAGASACAGTRQAADATIQYSLECVETQAPGYVCQGQFAEWPMPDATPGAKFAPSYDTSTAGVVRDAVTGLIWQRDTPASYPGCTATITNAGDGCLLAGARAYCANLTLGGRSDWRLPSKIELESLLDTTRQSPAANPVFGVRLRFRRLCGAVEWRGLLISQRRAELT